MANLYPERQRECLYYLALGSYRQGALPEARMYIAKFLEKEPNNAQGVALQKLVKEKMIQDGFVGMAIVGGAAAILAAGAAYFFRKK
jgi:mitochondrial fission 1 protein